LHKGNLFKLNKQMTDKEKILNVVQEAFTHKTNLLKFLHDFRILSNLRQLDPKKFDYPYTDNEILFEWDNKRVYMFMNIDTWKLRLAENE